MALAPHGVTLTPWNGTQAHLESMVSDLLGPGVTVTDVRFTGAQPSLGYVENAYLGGDRDLDGIVLSTGDVHRAVAPGLPGLSTSFGRPGYQRLTDLVPPYATYDAAILQIDIQTARYLLGFDYLFASNEYPGFVGSQYNDVFGFWSQNTNCALLPDGRPVSVNAEQFSDAGGRDTGLNGLAPERRCNLLGAPGQTVTLELAIADVSDSIYDSAVFIRAGSLGS